MDEVLVPRHALVKLFHLYQVYWYQVSTVDIDDKNYQGISFEDNNALDEAAEQIEEVEQIITEILGR
jgi:hypothetical protein